MFDYKSSAKNSDLNEVYAGLQIQLLTYTDAICKQEDIMPAGIFYFSLLEQMIKADKKIDEEKLQSPENSLAVSIAGKTADNTHLYMFARSLIDSYKQKYNVIVSGRDLMKIYPDMNYHFLITASLDERVRRKCIQYNEIEKIEEIRQNIIKRDKLQEEAGFYEKYENTIEIDVTKCKDANDGAEKIISYIKEL